MFGEVIFVFVIEIRLRQVIDIVEGDTFGFLGTVAYIMYLWSR